MNLALLSTAIKARITADTADGGLNGATNKLLTGGFHLDLSPPTATAPRVVWVISLTGPRNTFATDGADALIEFYIYTDRTDDFTDAKSIIDRLWGDAMANNPPVPTFGFHRHVLSISGYGATACAFQGADSASDEDTRIWRVAFTLSLFKNSTA